VIRVKPGVRFTTVAPAGFLILTALKAASRKLGKDLTITSGTDGLHSGPLDPHHLGEAFDIRSHDFPEALRPVVLKAIMEELDPARFYGFLEAPGQANEHFHLQRRKGTMFSVEDFLRDEPVSRGTILESSVATS
jgi:hypothetical protein